LQGKLANDDKEILRPRIGILPARAHITTVTKAPMAHKTNSKEQFLFKVYNFKFSFKFPVPSKLSASGVGQGAYVLLLTKRLFPVFETNLLFLKAYKISYPITDTRTFRKL